MPPVSLDRKIAERQSFGSNYARPPSAEAQFEKLRARVLALPPHPEWVDADLTDWTADPFGDRNWKFQYHTLRWLNPVRHLALEGNAEARELWVRVVRSWSEANVPPEKSESAWAWVDMADGNRAIALSLGSDLVKSDDAWFVTLLETHRDWLLDESHMAARNHAMHQLTGLFVVAAALRDRRAMGVAIERLERLFEKTFDKQGVNDEGSVGYHRFNLTWWTEAWRRVRAENMAIPPSVERTLDQAATVLAHFALPDASLPQIGDTARGKVTEDFNAHTAWIASAGERGAPPEDVAIVYERGYVVSRSAWGRATGSKASHVLMRFGPPVRAHSHRDQGAVHLYTGGRPWLVDGGFHNYQAKDAVRQHTLGRMAHNVSYIPGMSFDDSAPVELVEWDISPDWHDFTFWDRGYKDVRLERRVTYFPSPDVWIIHDRVQGGETSSLAHQWLVDTGVRVSRHDHGYVLRSGAQMAPMHWLGRQVPRLSLHLATDGDLRGWIATRWKTLEPGALVTASVNPRIDPRLVMLMPGLSRRGRFAVEFSDVNTVGSVSVRATRGDQSWHLRVGSDGVTLKETSS